MTISMYQASVPVFLQMLQNLQKIIEKAVKYSKDRRIEPTALIGARLYPDMFPFSKQIIIASGTAANCAARLAGTDLPNLDADPSSFEGLMEIVKKAIDFLESVKPEQIDGTDEKKIAYTQHGRDYDFVGLSFLMNYSIPNFLFHVTTAYDILRHNGLEIGKKDFLG